jgi:hypothetical protein
MRVFKNKWFNRWARGEAISDVILLNAAEEIVMGKVESDLGGYLFKKRLARARSGKRGGYRTIVGYRRPNSERIIFLYAYAKNDRANISDKEQAALSLVVEAFISTPDSQLNELIKQGSVWEVKHHE